MTEQQIKPGLGPVFVWAIVANVLAGVLLFAYIAAAVLAAVNDLAIFYYFLFYLQPLILAVPVAILLNIIIGVKNRKNRPGLSLVLTMLACLFMGFGVYIIL